MSLFKKKTEAKTQTGTRELTQADLAVVAGGINPQPLPPGRAIKL